LQPPHRPRQQRSIIDILVPTHLSRLPTVACIHTGPSNRQSARPTTDTTSITVVANAALRRA
jgi:hypothetical protein